MIDYSRRNVSYSVPPQSGHVFVFVSIVFPQPRHSIATAERQCGHVSRPTLIAVPQDGHSTDRDSLEQKGSILLSIDNAILHVLIFIRCTLVSIGIVVEGSISVDTNQRQNRDSVNWIARNHCCHSPPENLMAAHCINNRSRKHSNRLQRIDM